MSAWMLYALAASLVTALAGGAAERALERLSRPARWVWAAGMLTAVVAPLAAVRSELLASAATIPGSASVGAVMVEGTAFAAAVPAPVTRITLDMALLVAWLIGSAVLTLVLLRSFLTLRRARAGWRRKVLEGTEVRISDEAGPAVVGFFRPCVVLPGWVMKRDPTLRRLILSHEREHLWAGDSRLLLGALFLLVMMPWNPVLWWQWRRLRLAVETDCDRRVLRSQPDVERYGRLLLEVAGRADPWALPMAAFAESRSFLERRITMMTSRRAGNRLRWGLALAAALLAAPTALMALPAPQPVYLGGAANLLAPWLSGGKGIQIFAGPASPPAAVPQYLLIASASDAEVAPRVARAGTLDTVPVGLDAVPTDSSTFTYSVQVLRKAPRLLNANEVQGLLSQYYPRMMQDAGIGGTVNLQFVIERDGSVHPATVKVVSSTRTEFNAPAVAVVSQFRFSPGLYGDTPVRVLVNMPLNWSPGTPEPDAQDSTHHVIHHVETPSSVALESRLSAHLGKISGVVRNAATGKPISGATVVISDESRGALTDSDGRFIITLLSPGSQTLTVLAPGAEDPVTQTAVVRAGATTAVEIGVGVRAAAPADFSGVPSDQ